MKNLILKMINLNLHHHQITPRPTNTYSSSEEETRFIDPTRPQPPIPHHVQIIGYDEQQQ